MTTPHRRRIAPSLLALLHVAACTAAPRQPAPGTAEPVPPARSGASAGHEGAGERTTPSDTAADARFMQRMIPHHAQALEMTALVPARTRSQPIRLLAERIAVSQQDEIAQMQRWLRQRGAQVPGGTAGHAEHGVGGQHGGMPGMLTAEEFARLAAARDAAFDRLFLELMIRHHEGALVMVQELFASSGGGQQSLSFAIASEVDADQRAEIARMRRLLAALPSGGAGR